MTEAPHTTTGFGGAPGRVISLPPYVNLLDMCGLGGER